ncbi:hypothetical protein CASFOL_004768 [Castilleja foliolosa]|uniref:Uncharacterized protein n=1 Tax=Castilleja foliolosa TaxID=1961234 RepID=A0ABD3EC84_9LAMI
MANETNQRSISRCHMLKRVKSAPQGTIEAEAQFHISDSTKDIDREKGGDPNESNSRRKLDSDIENRSVNQIVMVCDEIGSAQPNRQNSVSSRLSSPPRVYTRTFRPNDCLKNSRKLGRIFPSLFKKKRKRRSRPTSFDKFIIRLVSVSLKTQKRKRCEPFNLGPGSRVTRSRKHLALALKSNWVGRRKRSRKSTRTRDLSSLCMKVQHLEKTKVSIEKQELSDVFHCNENIQNSPDFEYHIRGVVEIDEMELENITIVDVLNYRDLDLGSAYFVGCYDDAEEDDEKEDVLASQDYDLYTKALIDFSQMMMESLDIEDVCNQLVLESQIDEKIDTLQSKVDKSTKQQLVLWNQSDCNNEKSDTPKKRRSRLKVDKSAKQQLVLVNPSDTVFKEKPYTTKKIQLKLEKKKYREQQVDKSIYAMHLIQGDEHFSPWKGSVVDSVVCVLLILHVNNYLFSQAFMNLVSRFPIGDVVNDSAIHDSELLKIIEQLSDRVDPEQLSMMEKSDRVDPEQLSMMEKKDNLEGNVNSSQIACFEKEKNEDKKDTKHWDELRRRYSTPENRTYFKNDSVNWDQVIEMSYHALTVVILKRSNNYLIAGRIKDFLIRMRKDHGSIDLEWLKDVSPQEAKKYLLSITGLCEKSVELVRLLSLSR